MMSLIKALVWSLYLAATRVRIENCFSASATDKVPSAESFLPLNGNVSGPRWHCVLLMQSQVWLDQADRFVRDTL